MLTPKKETEGVAARHIGGKHGSYVRKAWILFVVAGITTSAFGSILLVVGLISAASNGWISAAGITASGTAAGLTVDNAESTLGFTIIGILFVVVAWKPFRRGEKWAWYSLLTAPIAYLFAIWIEGPPITYVPLIGAVLSVTGLILSVKVILPTSKETTSLLTT